MTSSRATNKGRSNENYGIIPIAVGSCQNLLLFFDFFLTDKDLDSILGHWWGIVGNFGESERFVASYTGRYVVSVDGKGRVAVPARLRAVASAQGTEAFMLNRGMDGCLELYSEIDWKNVEEKLAADHPIADADSRFFRRSFYSYVVPAPTDRQGRILIPAFLIALAGIEKEVLILGVGDKIEIWNEQRYNDYGQKFGESPEQVVERLFGKKQ